MVGRQQVNLPESVARQVEFYLSDANLRRDKFFQEKVRQDKFVPIQDFLNCNKVKQLTKSPQVVAEAIDKFSQGKLVLNEDKTKIARADHEAFDLEALLSSESPESVFVCNLPIGSSVNSLRMTHFEDSYVNFKEPSSRKVVLPVAFVEFGTPEQLTAFTSKDGVSELPFPGDDSNYDKNTLYYLPQSKWDEYVKKGETEFRFNAKTLAHFSVKKNMEKKYPPLKKMFENMMKKDVDYIVPKKTIGFSRHLFVEFDSEEAIDHIYEKFAKEKKIKFGGAFPFMAKVEPVLAVLLYQHFKLFGEPTAEPTTTSNNTADSPKTGQKRKADESVGKSPEKEASRATKSGSPSPKKTKQ